MTSETTRFEEILDKSLTQEERNLLRDLLTEKEERTPLQKLFDKYDMCVREERDYKEKLKVALKEFVECKDEDGMGLLIEERLKVWRRRLCFFKTSRRRLRRKF